MKLNEIKGLADRIGFTGERIHPNFCDGLRVTNGESFVRPDAPQASVNFVRALELAMDRDAAGITPRTKLIVERMTRATGDGHALDVTADASVDEAGGAVDHAAIKAEKTVLLFGRLLVC